MRTIATALLVGALSVPSLASAGEAKHTEAKHTEAKHTKEAQVSRGIASVYSRHLVGRRTATGERLDMEHMTAASLKLPLGTVVTVTNRRNGRKATVRVNDRGPYTKRFVIDLSPAAAAALGLGRTGTTPVEIKIASDAHHS
ncbi:MAG TPA: septal ring lytic transglycosylase RlpA family protein [Stellaceae bacterium]|jgi:rare lipoprotein A|nr:septal ring lytic transglycosylase RlpA family protein [Stellaceae bacterium]